MLHLNAPSSLLHNTLNLHPQVTVDAVLKTLFENAGKATRIILAAVPVIARENWSNTHQEIKVRECTAKGCNLLRGFICWSHI